MNTNDEKYVCSYCQNEFDSFNKNIVVCDKCGAPCHRDCWEENGKCSTYACGCTTYHNIIGPHKAEQKTVEKIKIVNTPVIVEQPVRSNSNILMVFILSAVLVIVLGLGFIAFRIFQQDKIQTKINVPTSEVLIDKNDGNKDFYWSMENYEDDKGIEIINKYPDLFDIDDTDKKHLIIIPKNNGEGEFTIKVKNSHLNVSNNNCKVKVKIIDPNEPNIVLLNPFNELKISDGEKELKVKIDKGTVCTNKKAAFQTIEGKDCINNINKDNIDDDYDNNNNVIGYTFKFKAKSKGKVKINLIIWAIYNSKEYELTKDVEFDVVE